MELNEYAVKLFQAVEEVEGLKFFEESATLSKTEFRLLREVIAEREKGRDIISSELAKRLGITRSAVSQIVSKLESRGIVVRAAAEHDRKIAYVRLSEKSIAIYEAQCSQANRLLAQVADKFGESRAKSLAGECEDFLRLLKETHREMCEEKEQNSD